MTNCNGTQRVSANFFNIFCHPVSNIGRTKCFLRGILDLLVPLTPLSAASRRVSFLLKWQRLPFHPTGLRQPWPAWPRLHLLAPAVHWPGDGQGGSTVREASDLWGDGPDRAHPAGRAHLPHRLSGVCLSQTPQRLCGGQPRDPPEAPARAAQQVGGSRSCTLWSGSSWLHFFTSFFDTAELPLIGSVPPPNSIDTGESPVSGGPAAAMDQPHVIPSQGDLLGDLLNLDLGPPVNVPQVSSMQMGAVDLLGGGLDSLVSSFYTHTHTWCWFNWALSVYGANFPPFQAWCLYSYVCNVIHAAVLDFEKRSSLFLRADGVSGLLGRFLANVLKSYLEMWQLVNAGEGKHWRATVAKKVSVSVCVCAFGCVCPWCADAVFLGACLFPPVAGGRPGRRCWGQSSSKSSPSVRPVCML